jgi:plastocyanin
MRNMKSNQLKNARVSSVIAAVILLVGCGADSQDSEATTIETVPANGEVITIQALDNSFRPFDFEIAAGTEVIFDNRGRNDHNILPDTIKDDAGLTALLASDTSPTAWGVASPDFVPGDTYSHLFNVPGTYNYYCSIHGAPGAGMYGTLVVS